MTKTETKKAKKIDFTEGPLFWRLIWFALPLMATGILQMMYNAADKYVVGNFSGDPNALGAIGCTATLGAFIINFMNGVGAGGGVVVSQLFGAKRHDETKRAVHTALILAVFLSLALTAVGYITLEPTLRLLGTQDKFMANALLYLRITYIGILATAVYNFGAAILRAVGDSRTPLIIGAISGAINVLLNLIFVCCFDMSVDGVALATIVSQYFSATTVIIVLMNRKGESYQFSFRELKVDKTLLFRIMRLGIPTGLQSSTYTITNLITVSAVNSFPDVYVTAFSISSNIDGFLDVTSGAFMTTAMNSVGQNYGAGNTKRVRRVFRYVLLQATVITFTVAMIMRAFRSELAGMFIEPNAENREAIIAAVAEWTGLMLSTYFLQGVMNAIMGTVRGMGYSFAPLILNIIGTCVVRVFWIWCIFPLEPFHSFSGLAMVYPVSWTTASLMLAILVVVAFVNLKKIEKANELAEAKAAREAEALDAENSNEDAMA